MLIQKKKMPVTGEKKSTAPHRVQKKIPSSSKKTKVQKSKKSSILSSSNTLLKIEALQKKIVKILDAGKAQNIMSINLRGQTSLADYIIIASGLSSRQVNALATNLFEKLKQEKIPTRIEGKQGTSDWIILDLGDIIVHIFHPKARSFYSIEELWGAQTPPVE